MTMMYRVFAAAFVICAISSISMAGPIAVNLDFDAAVPGTLTDTNGLGTGFTTRLPGTGGTIPANDPGLNLLSRPGYLQMTAANGNIGGIEGGVNLPIADAPGVLLGGIHAQDLKIVAKFDDVDVPDYQFAVYIGTQSTLSIRAGFHGPYQYYLAANDGTGGDFGWSSGANAYLAGDDIILTVERTGGLWSVSWENLTHPLMSGSSQTSGIGTGSTPFPLLNAQPDLYTGAIEAAIIPHIGSIDYLHITSVPEPSTAMLSVGVVGFFVLRAFAKVRGRPK